MSMRSALTTDFCADEIVDFNIFLGIASRNREDVLLYCVINMGLFYCWLSCVHANGCEFAGMTSKQCAKEPSKISGFITEIKTVWMKYINFRCPCL